MYYLTCQDENGQLVDSMGHLQKMDHAPHPDFEPDSLVLPGAGVTAQYMLRCTNSDFPPVAVAFLYTVEGSIDDFWYYH